MTNALNRSRIGRYLGTLTALYLGELDSRLKIHLRLS